MASSVDKLLSPERARFVRFCVVGASGVVVNLGVFTLVSLVAGSSLTADTRFLVANACGFAVSVCTNFLLNEFWTFGDRELHRSHTQFLRRIVKFYLVASVAGVVQLGVAFAARNVLGMWDQVAVLCGIAIATGINFVANNLWTFRVKGPRSPSASSSPRA